LALQLPSPVLHRLGDAQTNFDALARLLEVPRVTTLPAAPFDGQAVDFVADDTNGVIWRLRYRTASASNFKWEFVGGAPLMASASVGVAVVGATFGGSGPTVVAPLAGDYEVDVRGSINISNAGSSGELKAGSSASNLSTAKDLAINNNVSSWSPVGVLGVLTNVGAGASIQPYIRSGSAGVTVTMQERRVAVRPVRVG